MGERDAEIQVIKTLDKFDLSVLPVSVKADFIETLSNPISDEEFKNFDVDIKSIRQQADEQLLRLHNSFYYGNAYQSWDQGKQIELAEELMHDPLLVNARKRWDIPEGQNGHIALDERVAVLQHVIDKQAQIYQEGNNYGVFRATIESADLPGRVFGGFSDLSQQMVVSDKHLMAKNFDDCITAAIHEQHHAVQLAVKIAVQNDIITPEDPIFFDAIVIANNTSLGGRYFSSDKYGEDIYKRNPRESSSADVGYRLKGFAGLWDKDAKILAVEKDEYRELKSRIEHWKDTVKDIKTGAMQEQVFQPETGKLEFVNQEYDESRLKPLDDFVLDNYVAIDCEYPGLKEAIEKTLHHMASTPEGRLVLEKAFDQNDNQRVLVHGKMDGDNEAFYKDDTDTPYDTNAAVVTIEGTRRTTYYNEDRDVFDSSLMSIVFHEISHMAREPFASSGPINEDAIIRETNEYLQKYFDADERVGHRHNEIEGSPQLEVFPSPKSI